MRRLSLFVLLALSAVMAGSVAAVVRRPWSSVPTAIRTEVTVAELDDAWERSAPYRGFVHGQVAAGIVPHHLLASPATAGFFRRWSGPPPATVVILSPDHTHRSRSYVTTTSRSWATPDGRLEADGEAIQALVNGGLAELDDDLLAHEHGLGNVVPFVARAFPAARVVPLVIRGDLRPDRIQELVQALDAALGPDQLLLASVDFSHYRDAGGAWIDDTASLPVIERLDPDAALSIPVDSPPAISALLRFARLRNLQPAVLAHTNSAELTGDLAAGSITSYVTVAFSRTDN